MALVRITEVAEGVRLGLWRMSETADDFAHTPIYNDVCSRYGGKARRMEAFCAHALLWAMTGDGLLRISHEPSGCPFVVGMSGDDDACAARDVCIGISHTVGWVALILSDHGPVAVDIEYRSARVRRVAPRFLRPDEPFATVEEMLLAWCAKETVYKLYPSDNLAAADMRVGAFRLADSGLLEVHNMRRQSVVDLRYELTADYALTYTV